MAAELEQKKENWIESTRAYLTDIRSEMKRVTWPNKTQVQSTTMVVILSVFIFAIYFKIVDQVIENTVVKAYTVLVK
jgi:preprotein translocase subunit SecE